jgi:hypothetical protein
LLKRVEARHCRLASSYLGSNGKQLRVNTCESGGKRSAVTTDAEAGRLLAVVTVAA